MEYSRSQTPILPKNVEDGVNKFRVGEDFALAHKLQEREYENHQRYNHEQRHVVQSDIRLAKRAQSVEEERARARGILTEAEKRQIEIRDREMAEKYQQDNIERFVEIQKAEAEGKNLAEEILSEEQREFHRQEVRARKLENLRKKDEEDAQRIQQYEIERFKEAERRIREAAAIAERDEELARRLAAEEENNLDPDPQDDESLAIRLANREREKAERKKRINEEDRKMAQQLLEKDFQKYQKMNNARPRQASVDDLLAIQEIELDRGNYNRPVKTGAYADQRDLVPRDKSRTPKKSKEARSDHRSKRSPQKQRHQHNSRDDRSRNPQTNCASNSPKPYRNVSSEYRSPKKDTVIRPPAQYSDDGESVESFGEFRSPKTHVNPRRAMSLESILDSESVAADEGHVTLRIKPGVYQKRPDVVMAEIEHQRHKQNRRDKRRLNPPPQKKGRRPAPSNQKFTPDRVYQPHNPPSNGYANNPNDGQVHDMLYGRGPPRRPKKKKQSDCSIM